MDVKASREKVDAQLAVAISAQESANEAFTKAAILTFKHSFEYDCPAVIQRLLKAVKQTPYAKGIQTFARDFAGYKLNDSGNPSLDTALRNERLSKANAILADLGTNSFSDWVKEYDKEQANTPDGQAKKAEKKAKELAKAKKLVRDSIESGNDLAAKELLKLQDQVADLYQKNPNQTVDMLQRYNREIMQAIGNAFSKAA